MIFGCEDQGKEGAAKGKTFLGCEKKKKKTMVDIPFSAYLVTILSPTFLFSLTFHSWVKLKACKWPCCSQIHSKCLQQQCLIGKIGSTKHFYCQGRRVLKLPEGSQAKTIQSDLMDQPLTFKLCTLRFPEFSNDSRSILLTPWFSLNLQKKTLI